MKVVLIGSGNVATVLGRLIKDAGHEILQVLSRNPLHAKVLADRLGASSGDLNAAPDMQADLFIVSIIDSGYADQLGQFKMGNKLVLHTGGSVSKDVLQNFSTNYGVLYPLQTLRKELTTIPTIPFLIDANNEGAIVFIEEFARTFSQKVGRANDEQRLKLHTAAVIVSNFTNHLYALTETFCLAEQVNFDMLKPLILETANRIEHASPADVQTGPAIRKDIQTLDKHLRVLSLHPKLRTTYMRLTDSIMNP